MAAAALLTFGVGMAALYGGRTAAGARPAEAAAAARGADEQRASLLARRVPGQIEQDARAFGLKAPTLEELAAPFPYVAELASKHTVKPRAPVETAHVRVSMEVEKRQATIEGQTFGFEHVVLRIENLTGNYLAYRIETRVPDRKKCMSKGDIPHNAIVLEPRQTIRRTECLYRQAPGWT